MTPIKLTIFGTGAGTCSLTGKDSVDGLTVTFEDGTVKDAFVSWKSFRQLLQLKSSQAGKPGPKVPAAAPGGESTVGASK